MVVAHAIAALIAAYIPVRLACTAIFYCREQGTPREHSRWERAADWITRHPNLFPHGRRFLTTPAALCLVTVTASGATRLFL
ncbi:hypothetical protein GCM10009839_44470 [Catenulispora yoronensis]|uniref:Uncharacterized protein n=1 Tax=Catenulispora yoronensis TaxID=450799 RepID=A0ABP5G0T9_9ACTN